MHGREAMAPDETLLTGIFDLLQILTWQIGNQGAKSRSKRPELLSQAGAAKVRPVGDGTTSTIADLRRRLPGIETPPDAFTREDVSTNGH